MLRRGLVLVAYLYACDGSDGGAEIGEVPNTVAGCREQFSASRGYGYQSDDNPTLVTAVSGIGGSAANNTGSRPSTGEPQSALARAVSDCMAHATTTAGNPGLDGGGADATLGSDSCAVFELMTHEAAVCSARAQGLGEGLEGYYAELLFDAGIQRIVWRVRNVTVRNQGQKRGESMLLDAITAQVLSSSDWEGAN